MELKTSFNDVTSLTAEPFMEKSRFELYGDGLYFVVVLIFSFVINDRIIVMHLRAGTSSLFLSDISRFFFFIFQTGVCYPIYAFLFFYLFFSPFFSLYFSSSLNFIEFLRF